MNNLITLINEVTDRKEAVVVLCKIIEKRNVIKERIRQEKERRERLLAEEEEQYEDVYKDPISEQIQQEHSEQPRNQREESINVNLPKNQSSNSNPALD
jgi:colicin import membrane protein